MRQQLVRHTGGIVTHDPIAALLVAVLAELRGIRAVLEQQPRRPAPTTLSRDDRASLATLLPAIAADRGSEPFYVYELFEPEVGAGVRLVTRGFTASRIGRLFQRAEGYAVEGYTIARDGAARRIVMWTVLRVPAEPFRTVPPRPAPGAV